MNKYKIEEILSNIQFQVYSDMNFIEPLGLDKESWKELLEYINKQKEVLDKIKKELEEPDIYGVDEDGYDDAYYDKIYVRRIEELLEEIE